MQPHSSTLSALAVLCKALQEALWRLPRSVKALESVVDVPCFQALDLELQE